MSADRPVSAPDTVTDNLRQAIRAAIVSAVPPEDACLADEDACFERHPVHLAMEVDGEVRIVYARVDGLVDLVAEAVVPLIRAQIEAELGRTCQETTPSVFVNVDHVHECEREVGHRSPKHRCACGCEWWLRADVTAEPILAGCMSKAVDGDCGYRRGFVDSRDLPHACSRPLGHDGSHRCRCEGLGNYTWPADTPKEPTDA